mgnify:CR=1 FL=1
MASIDKMMEYAVSRWHKPRYVMGGGRIGAESSYTSKTDDCSSYVFKCLKKGGFISESTWNGSTEDLFKMARQGKLKEIKRSEVQRGDIFVSGVEGKSLNAGGHTGLFTRKGEIIHCNYGNGTVTTNNEREGYDYYLSSARRPVRFFRPVGAIESKPKKSVSEIAKEVIAGKWGVGGNRANKLQRAGYSYREVQNEVNRQLRNKPVYHTVKSGDSLSAIAKRYKVNLKDLLARNPQIENPNIIKVGQKIRIK